MPEGRFQIESTATHECWAEVRHGQLEVRRLARTPGAQEEVLVRWDRNVLRNLLTWADRNTAVTASITGVLAQQVYDSAKELGMPPEMLVWHAVKLFIEVGRASNSPTTTP